MAGVGSARFYLTPPIPRSSISALQVGPAGSHPYDAVFQAQPRLHEASRPLADGSTMIWKLRLGNADSRFGVVPETTVADVGHDSDHGSRLVDRQPAGNRIVIPERLARQRLGNQNDWFGAWPIGIREQSSGK